jgi:hypothetical protein
MNAAMMFLDRPADHGQSSTLRWGLPAKVRRRFTMRTADRPAERTM